MNTNGRLLLLALWLVPAVAVSQATLPRSTPAVVADLPRTISTRPFFEQFEGERPAIRGEANRQSSHVSDLRARPPIKPRVLRLAEPSVTVHHGLLRPIFIIGSGELSREWLMEAGSYLSRAGAEGVVIEADSDSAWRDIQALAAEFGLSLQLMRDARLAYDYELVTYPVVIASLESLSRPVDE